MLEHEQTVCTMLLPTKPLKGKLDYKKLLIELECWCTKKRVVGMVTIRNPLKGELDYKIATNAGILSGEDPKAGTTSVSPRPEGPSSRAGVEGPDPNLGGYTKQGREKQRQAEQTKREAERG